MNKELKKKSRSCIFKNYWHCVAIVFFTFILLGKFSFNSYNTYEANLSLVKAPFTTTITSQNFKIINDSINGINKVKKDIADYRPTKGLFANFFNNITASESFIFGFLNSLNQLIFKEKIWLSITMFLGATLTFIFYFFITNVFLVGECRFFLENINHKKTPFNRIFLPFRTGYYFNICKIMFKKTIYEILWWFTIVGGVIKHYEYLLIPYILAENPGINSKDAFILSRKMAQNHKFDLFKIDLSFILWNLLDFFTFHLTGTLYSTPLKIGCMSNYYLILRENAIKRKFNNYIYLADKELLAICDLYPKDKYIYKEKKKIFIKTTNYQKKYSLISIILMFFTASIIGYIWEVLIHFIQYGTIVNRGALHGPWLPIYGWGAIILIVFLRKYRSEPLKTLILSIVLCGIVEYFTSLYLEIFKHASWWDYHGFFLNIHGRVCLEGLIAFGVGGCAFIYFLAPFLENIYMKINKKIKIVLCIFLSILYIGDSLYSGKHPNQGEGVSTNIEEKITEM